MCVASYLYKICVLADIPINPKKCKFLHLSYLVRWVGQSGLYLGWGVEVKWRHRGGVRWRPTAKTEAANHPWRTCPWSPPSNSWEHQIMWARVACACDPNNGKQLDSSEAFTYKSWHLVSTSDFQALVRDTSIIVHKRAWFFLALAQFLA